MTINHSSLKYSIEHSYFFRMLHTHESYLVKLRMLRKQRGEKILEAIHDGDHKLKFDLLRWRGLSRPGMSVLTTRDYCISFNS